jgi:spore coat-associated protein N
MTRLRHLRLPISVLTILLAGLTAAFAATGSLPLAARGGDPATARALRAAGGLSISDSRGGQAILSATAMAPGETRSGEVTITNSGDVAGELTLSKSGLVDAGGPLSTTLDLAVDDITTGSPARVYAGKLAAMGALALGSIAAGGSRSYRFSTTFPQGSAAHDNALQGASSTVQFDWDATAPEPPPTTPPATTPTTPTTPASPLTLTLHAPTSESLRKGLTVAIRCSQDCAARIAGVAKIRGARKPLRLSATNTNLLAAKARTVRLKLSRKLKAALTRAIASRKRATITVDVRAQAPGGAAVRSTRSFRLKR